MNELTQNLPLPKDKLKVSPVPQPDGRAASDSSSKRWFKFRLRTVLVVPFILPIVASTTLVGWLSFRNGQEAIDDLATQLNREISDRIDQHVSDYLNKSHTVLKLAEAGIQSGNLKLDDFPALQRYFWQVVKANDLESYLSYGNEQGEFVGVEHQEDGTIQLKVRTAATAPIREVYLLDPQGRPQKLLKQKAYDPRTRPWYEAAKKAGKPTWSEIYPFFSRQNTSLGISPVRPIYDASGNLQGVLCINITLMRITDFLKNLYISPRGQSFIMDRSGDLVVSSVIPEPFVVTGKGDDRKITRIAAAASPNPIVSATAQYLRNHFGSLTEITQSQQLKFQIGQTWYYMQVAPVQDGRGIDWLSVVVVPTDDFMEHINANMQTTLVLCIVTFLLATALGVLTAQWISQQIGRLEQAAHALANDHLDQQVSVNGVVEVEHLADSFNQMSMHLKDSFEALRQSEATNRAMMAAIPDLLIRARKDGTYLEIVGQERFSVHATDQFLTGSTVYDSLPAELADRRIQAIQQALHTGEVQVYEQQLLVEDQWRDEEVRIVVARADEVLIIVRDITQRKQAEKSLKQLKDAFARFFPPEYLKFLGKDSVTHISLGDHVSREMAVLFSDIRSFTTLSESMTPQENFDFVNTYLQRVSPGIRKHDGVIVKFLGDGMMAVFPNGVDDAIEAGIDKFHQVELYNREREAQGFIPIQVGMGIHIGHLMVGMVGEDSRIQGDAFSDTVTLTSRLEGLTKFYGVSLLISEDVLNRLHRPDQYQIRFLDRAIVKGRTEPIGVYEVMDACDPTTRELKLRTLPDFESGLRHYCEGNLSAAQADFERVLSVNFLDKTTHLYLERIHQLQEQGVPSNWTGVWAFTQK